MRLLKRDADGEVSLTKDLVDDKFPKYAILSHTWGDPEEEVTFEDFIKGTMKSKTGYKKIQFSGEQAACDGLTYFWVDTCCIDKSSSAELQEAIISMFRWYQRAIKCYVYMSDVSVRDQSSRWNWEQAFRESRWFTRGWTLQELLAPRTGKKLGDKENLEDLVHDITRIPIKALKGIHMSQFEIDKRFSWAKGRYTTRKEDEAYSLLGIFGISMPVMYGEGRESAIKRLRREIYQASGEEDSTKIQKKGGLDEIALYSNKPQTLKGQSGPVYSVAFSPSGRQLASASSDRTVWLWDAAMGSALQILQGHRKTSLRSENPHDAKFYSRNSNERISTPHTREAILYFDHSDGK